MKKIFDILGSLLILIIIFFPTIILFIVIKLSSNETVLFWSERVGVNNKIYLMPKFRTMIKATPQKATHLLDDPEKYITKYGSILRRFSIDEIPQIYSILKGDMSLVGPRPALFNQYDLIKLRTEKNVSHLLPGLTGWAQVNGRDDLSIEEKVNLDVEYAKRKSFLFDIFIIFLTVKKVIYRDKVSH
tara:strand:- start:1883 stop:2443 length:561 start_codon:yes stop_codon:yes gene_type:complete